MSRLRLNANICGLPAECQCWDLGCCPKNSPKLPSCGDTNLTILVVRYKIKVGLTLTQVASPRHLDQRERSPFDYLFRYFLCPSRRETKGKMKDELMHVCCIELMMLEIVPHSNLRDCGEYLLIAYQKPLYIRSVVANLIPKPINNAPSPRSIQHDTVVFLLRYAVSLPPTRIKGGSTKAATTIIRKP